MNCFLNINNHLWALSVRDRIRSSTLLLLLLLTCSLARKLNRCCSRFCSLRARGEQRDTDSLTKNNVDDCKCPWASRARQEGEEAPAFVFPIQWWEGEGERRRETIGITTVLLAFALAAVLRPCRRMCIYVTNLYKYVLRSRKSNPLG